MRKFLINFEAYVCAILLFIMTILGFSNVVVRYLTNYSFASTQELLLIGFLLITIFGAALAARHGEHLAVTFFTDLLGKKYRKIAIILADVISIILLLLAAYYCYEMIINQYDSGVVSPGLLIPVWYYSLAMPFGFLLIIVRLIAHTAGVLRGEKDSDGGNQNV